MSNLNTLSQEEERLVKKIKKSKSLQEAIGKEINKTPVTIYQMALYRPLRLIRAEAVKRLAKSFIEPKKVA